MEEGKAKLEGEIGVDGNGNGDEDDSKSCSSGDIGEEGGSLIQGLFAYITSTVTNKLENLQNPTEVVASAVQYFDDNVAAVQQRVKASLDARAARAKIFEEQKQKSALKKQRQQEMEEIIKTRQLDPYFTDSIPKDMKTYREIVGQMEAEEIKALRETEPGCFGGVVYTVQNQVALCVETPLRMAWHMVCCVASPVPLFLCVDLPYCASESLCRCVHGERRRTMEERMEDYERRFVNEAVCTTVANGHLVNCGMYREDSHLLFVNSGCGCVSEFFWQETAMPKINIYAPDVDLERPVMPSGDCGDCCFLCECTFSLISDLLSMCGDDLLNAVVKEHYRHSYTSFSGVASCTPSRCIGEYPCFDSYEDVLNQWVVVKHNERIDRTRAFYIRRREHPERYIRVNSDDEGDVYMICDGDASQHVDKPCFCKTCFLNFFGWDATYAPTTTAEAIPSPSSATYTATKAVSRAEAMAERI